MYCSSITRFRNVLLHRLRYDPSGITYEGGKATFPRPVKLIFMNQEDNFHCCVVTVTGHCYLLGMKGYYWALFGITIPIISD